jgi:hypothetical protein
MAKKKPQVSSIFDFSDMESTENEWRGMPSFEQPDNGPFRQIIISFEDQAGIDAFAKLIDQHVTDKTKSLWYPPRERNNLTNLFWFDSNKDTEQ